MLSRKGVGERCATLRPEMEELLRFGRFSLEIDSGACLLDESVLVHGC